MPPRLKALGRERQAEEAAGRSDPGQQRAAGCGEENDDARRQTRGAAHLEQVHGLSQRRACEALGLDRSSVRYRSRRRMTASFAPGCARSLPFAGASAIAGCMYCCGGKGRAEPQEASPGSTPRSGSRFAGVAAETRARHKGTAGLSTSSQPALVSRFSARPAERWPAVPHSRGRRRFQPEVPGPSSRCMTIRAAGSGANSMLSSRDAASLSRAPRITS